MSTAVRSVDKALQLIECFTLDATELSIGELASMTGMPKPTVVKLMATLRERGFVWQDQRSRRYRLGPALLATGVAAFQAMDIRLLAQTYMATLVEETEETAILMVRDGWRSLCVATVESPHPVRMRAAVGRYASLHAGASNKPILAFMTDGEIEAYLSSQWFVPRGPNSICDPEAMRRHLQSIRADGVAVSDYEVEAEVMAVGAPVFDARGTVIAALSVAGPRTRLGGLPLDKLKETVRRSADVLAQDLGYRGHRRDDERVAMLRDGHHAAGGRAGTYAADRREAPHPVPSPRQL